ncbi:2527_t:CDS:2, partial [Entrophospora sp. SA101]
SNEKDSILFVTEGISASSSVLTAFNIVKDENAEISDNKQIKKFEQELGLERNKIYNSTKDLKYNKLRMMMDQDYDGCHIKGLIINFLDCYYPLLLKQFGFLDELITPLIKCKKGKDIISFFSDVEYKKWVEQNENGKGWEIKYYK